MTEQMTINIRNARKILLCLRYGIGDLVMEMPALDALRRGAPEALIVGVGARPALQLLEGDPRVDALVCVQEWGLEHWGDPGTAEIRERITAWLREEDFDLVIDPSHAVTAVGSALWAFAPPLLDAGNELQERALRRGKDGLGAIREAVRLGWGIEVPEHSVPRIHLGREEVARAEAFLRRHGLEGERPVGVSPVASSPLKRWPLDRFAHLVDDLAEGAGAPVLLFHGPQRETGAALAGRLRHPRRVIPVGELHLRQVAALLARCRLFVGHDTGLMHMAAAVGTPLVALFGPTSPGIYLPRYVPAVPLGAGKPCPRRRTVSFGPPDCVVVGRCLEEGGRCIDQLLTGEVISAVHRAPAGGALRTPFAGGGHPCRT